MAISVNSLKTLWARRIIALLLALAATLLAGALAPGFFRMADEQAGDFFWRTYPLETPERRIVVVDIDESSLSRIGPWPWPRERIAELSRRLGAMGAGTQVFDIVLPDARPGDDRLSEELARQAAILSQIFTLGSEPSPASGAIQGALTTPACGAPMPVATGYIGNTPSLRAPVGHITPSLAADGVVRGVPALICFEGRSYPALGLAALMGAAKLPPALEVRPGNRWSDPDYWLTLPGLAGIRVPLDAKGDVRLSYQLPRSAFISIPAADVLAGQAPVDLIKGAWVLVGATAFGIADAVPTPSGGQVGGVEVHAQFLSALLDDRLPHTPRAAALMQGLMGGLAVAGLLLLAVRNQRRPALGLPLTALVLAAGMFAIQGGALLATQLWIGGAEPALFSLLAGLLLGFVEHARTRSEREALYLNLSSYLPASVASEIAYNQPSNAIEARRQEVTVLYVDLRNFSAWCENRPAEEAAALLHVFFTLVDRIVEAHGGVVEEYVGDAVMALWNTAQPSPDHPEKAVQAGRQILEEGQALLPEPPPGLEPMAIGIGIETGPALVGSFGPARRRTHTALGETVTVATRLQALTADLAEPLLIGPGAAARLPAKPEYIHLGTFLLDGLVQPRTVHAWRPTSEEAGHDA